ncbi:hypothetical protein [Rhodopirellula sp. P2]|uniref:hypothetical protein n=1 Tax=Rhodopirellula sp. P2 TaxID=2127060 RepID=UPI00236805E1|nr:hypothetical protein [Rhodopirellula sp. P2]WDQ17296.1 hypothetical protein PSR62_01770 [Rhodopirellula sp. P2]
MNTPLKTLSPTKRLLPAWASTGLVALAIAGLGAFFFASDASAQGYRYGIQSNGFNRGGSAIIGQRGGLPQNNYTARRPSISGTNSNRGSVTNYYYNTPRRSGYRGGYGYGGYGYGGYGYGYRSYGYGFVPGTVSGTGLQVGPGGGVQFGTGTYYAVPRYYGVPTYGFR